MVTTRIIRQRQKKGQQPLQLRRQPRQLTRHLQLQRHDYFCHQCLNHHQYEERPSKCFDCKGSSIFLERRNAAEMLTIEPVYVAPPLLVERTQPLVIVNNQIVNRNELEPRRGETKIELTPFVCTERTVPNEVDCAICLCPLIKGDQVDLTVTPDEVVAWPSCQHVFHFKCLTPWASKNDTCPKCRAPYTTETNE